jgi:hypothetical protein
MADGIAIISVVASSTVALAAVGAQVWQGRLNRANESRAWLRDRRTEAYIAILRQFVKGPDEVSLAEREEITARVAAFASPEMLSLFDQWADVVSTANDPANASVKDQWFATQATSFDSEVTLDRFGELFSRSITLQEEIKARAASELQRTET